MPVASESVFSPGMDTPEVSLEPGEKAAAPRTRLGAVLALPLAVIVAFAVHFIVSQKEPVRQTHTFSVLLEVVFVLSSLCACLQFWFIALRRWASHLFPIIAAAVLLLSLWEIITAGLHLLPLPYFPSPAAVLQNLLNDRSLLFDSTWHSLLLLLAGYLLGTTIALVTGVCIGWSWRARYWGMPLLKVVGPIPATAWIPLAMVLSPSGVLSAIGLIAIAVWFPVTMLTISGISNTRASYIDVARTLGASEKYLIFHVAIPAAMPNIFIGLFMGLGTSFIALIHAESVGVSSGLGWYVSWAQGWAEYGKVYAALVIMAAFFSTIMTFLFKLRDRVLVWQKGTIKW